jgi:hypothetical protein
LRSPCLASARLLPAVASAGGASSQRGKRCDYPLSRE